MKTLLILAALFTAFAIVGTVDYQVAATMAAARSPQSVAVAGGAHHAR